MHFPWWKYTRRWATTRYLKQTSRVSFPLKTTVVKRARWVQSFKFHFMSLSTFHLRHYKNQLLNIRHSAVCTTFLDPSLKMSMKGQTINESHSPPTPVRFPAEILASPGDLWNLVPNERQSSQSRCQFDKDCHIFRQTYAQVLKDRSRD